jgi:hypothetical protein
MPEIGISQHKADMLIHANICDDRHEQVCKDYETEELYFEEF